MSQNIFTGQQNQQLVADAGTMDYDTWLQKWDEYLMKVYFTHTIYTESRKIALNQTPRLQDGSPEA